MRYLLLFLFVTVANAGFKLETVAPGVIASIRTEPPGIMFEANVVFIVNDEDVVVVDANGTPTAAKESIAALRSITTKPVRYLVNTHWHTDHVTGNATWREAYPGLEIVAHATARADMAGTGEANRKSYLEAAPVLARRLRNMLEVRKNFAGESMTDEEVAGFTSDAELIERFATEAPGTPMVLPTLGIEERMTLTRGARTIDIRHLGPGHSRADLIVHLPVEGIVISGDLIVSPVPLVGSTSLPSQYAATLEKLIALRPKAIVPGHGPVLTDDRQPKLMVRMLESITKQVAAAVARGESLEQTRKSVDLAEFQRAFAGDSAQKAFIFKSYVAGPAVAAAYDQARTK
ncbi:MBL fold metallo-hydrolase [Usitatibacter palustris]|uniref:Metallo-beta-lactamase domain-containing protein n=1 Tax=Usitatibacter palustris TaxID=2732487 RepID=A0A6M4H1U3_9PROT|nr:MBL fold metallo-hydrolase [Usitatibacter palustris]QJR13479.1 hypothetical protein DSM104440_00263 [Usitatibacter palustris]